MGGPGVSFSHTNVYKYNDGEPESHFDLKIQAVCEAAAYTGTKLAVLPPKGNTR
jgi:hypothetical protein